MSTPTPARLRRRRVALVGVILAGLTALSALPGWAAGWPSVFHAYGRFDGTTFNDPIDQPAGNAIADLSSGVIAADAVGGLSSAYVAADGTDLLVRFRLKTTPGSTTGPNGWDASKGGLTGFAYVVQLSVNGAHVASVGLDGKTSAADYVYVAPVASIVKPEGTFTASVPKVVSTWSSTTNEIPGARITNAGNPAAPAETFVDFRVPIADITYVAPSITTSTPLQFFFGTSAAANLTTINKDYMSNAGETCTLVGCAEVQIGPAALGLEWTATPTLVSGTNPPVVGQESRYDLTVTARNKGLNQLTDVTIADVLPAHVQPISATTADGTAALSGQDLEWTPGALAPGRRVTLKVRVAVRPDGSWHGRPMPLTTGPSGSGFDAAAGTQSFASLPEIAVNPVGGSATSADLAVAVSGPAAAESGASLPYVIDVANLGPAAAAATVAHTLPSGLTSTSSNGTGWTCAADGQLVTCGQSAVTSAGSSAPPLTITATAGPGEVGLRTSSATVAPTTGSDANSANNTASVGTTLTAPDVPTPPATTEPALPTDAPSPTEVATDPVSEQPTEATELPTPGPTDEPTDEPTEEPTADPTEEPSADPTLEPTDEPTLDPTDEPTLDPTDEPTVDPTDEQTVDPTDEPTLDPTDEPTVDPTDEPMVEPTLDPTEDPTVEPTAEPTGGPTPVPTDGPTPEPTIGPTTEPTPTPEPTADPTDTPTDEPTEGPTETPTTNPSESPTPEPTEGPSEQPTPEPTEDPTPEPTVGPTPAPTDTPSDTPTDDPTDPATLVPPTQPPSDLPTAPSTDAPGDPSEMPTEEATATPTPTTDATDSPSDDPTDDPTTPAPTPSGPTATPTPEATEPTDPPTAPVSEASDGPTDPSSDSPTTEPPTTPPSDGPTDPGSETPTEAGPAQPPADEPTAPGSASPEPTVAPVPPTALDDQAGGQLGQAVTVDVLANDSAPGSVLDTSTLVVTRALEHGVIVNINTTTGAVTYRPDATFEGTDTFRYRVCSSNGLCDTADVHTATPPVDLQITVARTGNPLVKGGTAVYAITVTNLGPRHADGPLTLTVAAPAGLGDARATAPGWTLASAIAAAPISPSLAAFGPQLGLAGPSVTLQWPGGLAVDASSMITMTGTVTGEPGSEVVVVAQVSGPDIELEYANNEASALDVLGVGEVDPTASPEPIDPDEPTDPDEPVDRDPGEPGDDQDGAEQTVRPPGDKVAPDPTDPTQPDPTTPDDPSDGQNPSDASPDNAFPDWPWDGAVDGGSEDDHTLAATGADVPSMLLVGVALLCAGIAILQRSRYSPKLSSWCAGPVRPPR